MNGIRVDMIFCFTFSPTLLFFQGSKKKTKDTYLDAFFTLVKVGRKDFLSDGFQAFSVRLAYPSNWCEAMDVSALETVLHSSCTKCIDHSSWLARRAQTEEDN